MPRLRGREEIGLMERYERHGLDQMLFAARRCRRQRSERCWNKRYSKSSCGKVSRSPEAVSAIVVAGIYLRHRRSVSQPRRKGVLLVAVGVREGGGFEVLGCRTTAETTKDYEKLLTPVMEARVGASWNGS